MEQPQHATSVLPPQARVNNTAGLYTSAIANPTITTLVILCLLPLITRILSTLRSTKTAPGTSSSSGNGNPKPVPSVPYWLPIVGHIPNMILDASGFTRGLRARYSQGAYALNMGGAVHNVLYTPGLATALLNSKAENASEHEVFDGLMETVFGWPMRREAAKYRAMYAELMACYRLLLGEPSLGVMVARTAESVRATIGDFVTFSYSMVDQMQWERTGQVILMKDNEQVVEGNLLDLVKDWCAMNASPSIMGSNFSTNFPGFFRELWTVDNGFLLLVAGLPRWLPIPKLTRAHIARRNLLRMLEEFHRAMDEWAAGQDAGQEWRDLDDVGDLVKARVEIYRKHGLSMAGRASYEFCLLWAANANSNSLVFWMVNHIYADKQLLAMLREEIEPYVRAVQPRQDFPIPEAARLERLDVEGLCANCPLLKSCYVECLRFDTAPWSLKMVQQDFVLAGRDKEAQAFHLRKGEYVHAAHDLHNTDPKYFEHPDVWKADRHVKYDEQKKAKVDLGSIRPYGGGPSMCKGRSFAFKECMMFTAAIIAMWDIETVGGGDWKMPKHVKASGTYNTSDPTRVRIKRRKLPAHDS